MKRAVFEPQMPESALDLFVANESGISGPQEAIRRLRERFEPARAGRRDALREEPNLNSGRQSSQEYSIAIASQAEIDRYRGQAERRLRMLDIALKRLPPLPEIEADLVMARLDADHDSALRAWREPLGEARRAAVRSKRGLSAFREENEPVQLRPARRPNRAVAAAVILAALLGEGAFNFMLLAGSGGQTAAETLLLVFISASLNVSLALVGLGFIGVRNLWHAKPERKLFGGAVLLASVSALLLLHLALAHYRLALDQVRADPAAIADATAMQQRIVEIPVSIGGTLASHPFAFLRDLHAILVFLMGLGFAAVSAYDGARLLADYPGYAEVEQACHRAAAASELERQDFEQSIASIAEKAKSSLDAVVQTARQRLNRVKSVLDAAVDVTRRHEESANAIECAMLQLVDEYRSSYRRTRNAGGPPQWEDSEPRLNRELPSGIDNLEQIEEREQAEYAGLRQRAEELKVRITVAQTQLIERVKTYMEAIDNDAQRDEAAARAELHGVRMPLPSAQEG